MCNFYGKNIWTKRKGGEIMVVVSVVVATGLYIYIYVLSWELEGGRTPLLATKPKSPTLMEPSREKKMLEGFKSRWIMPFPCT